MRRLVLLLLGSGVVAVAIYLGTPRVGLPPPPAGVVESREPADTESEYRKAYFSDLTREEIMSHYYQAFTDFGQFRLNLPPEDATTVIRDQTRSSFLEQLVHPGRETLYVNGFFAIEPQDQMIVDGRYFANKITVRYVPYSPAAGWTVWGLVLIVVYWLVKEYRHV